MPRLRPPCGVDFYEEVDEYRPGGFHPVHLRDLLDGRYEVLHKLGYGGFSTTWLVRDTVGIGYKAVKIVKAEETEASSEVRTLQHLASLETDHPGRNHIRRLTSHFILEGPNGRHRCPVMDVAGVSLQN